METIGINRSVKPSTTSLVRFISKLLITAVGFIGTIVFARVLGSTILGTYFLIIAVLSWLEFVGQLGVTSAIRKRISERGSPDEFLSAGALLQMAVLFVLVIIIFIFRSYLNNYIGAEVGWILLLMLSVKISFELMKVVLQGQHRVATASLLDLSSKTVRSALQIALVFLGFGLVGLLSGYIIAFFLATLGGIVLIASRYDPTRPGSEHFKQLLEFARYSWLGALKSRTSAWMDTIVLGFFVTPSLIGIYEVSWNIAMVLVLASQSISSALFPTISELATGDRANNVRDLLEQSFVYAGLIAIPGTVGAVLLAPDLLHFYGTEFTKARVVLSILALSAVFSSYEGQLQNGLNALDRPDLAFRANGIFITINLTGNVILVAIFGWIGAAVATTMSIAASLGYTYYVIQQVVGLSVPYRELLYQVLAAGFMGLVVVGVNSIVSAYPYYYVLVPVGIGIFVYFAVLLILSSRVRNKMQTLLRDIDVVGLLE